LFPNIILFIYNRFIGCENETILSRYKERERERERERRRRGIPWLTFGRTQNTINNDAET
jgi:hypothetical protein